MPKAYWVAHVIVTNPEQYKLYVDGARPALEQHGAKVLARGGRYEQLEGPDRPRNVVIEFPSLEAASACFHSEIYQKARAHRLAVSEISLVIVEGVE